MQFAEIKFSFTPGFSPVIRLVVEGKPFKRFLVVLPNAEFTALKRGVNEIVR